MGKLLHSIHRSTYCFTPGPAAVYTANTRAVDHTTQTGRVVAERGAVSDSRSSQRKCCTTVFDQTISSIGFMSSAATEVISQGSFTNVWSSVGYPLTIPIYPTKMCCSVDKFYWRTLFYVYAICKFARSTRTFKSHKMTPTQAGYCARHKPCPGIAILFWQAQHSFAC